MKLEMKKTEVQKVQKQEVQKNSLSQKAVKVYKNVSKACIAAFTSFKLGFFEAQVAMATGGTSGSTAGGLDAPQISVNTNANATEIIGKAGGLIFSIFQLVGLVLAIFGFVQLIMGFKDDNPDSKTKGITLLIVGILLMCLQTLARSINLIK